jgi:hypothetical protein
MTILFKNDGAWGTGLGRPLHSIEVDDNFYDVDRRLVAMDTAVTGLMGSTIVDVRQVGDQIFFDMSDSSTLGPITLPSMHINFVGEWTPSTLYSKNDIFTYGGAAYIVLVDLTSDTFFDANANDGNGHNFYGVLLEAPLATVPAGGTTGQALTKWGDGDYQTAWSSAALPAGGSTRMVLTKTSGQDYAVAWQSPVQQQATLTTALPLSGGGYTIKATTNLVVGDEFKYFRALNSSSFSITIPLNSQQPFQVDSEITFRQCGAGVLTFSTYNGSVLLNFPDTFLAQTYGKGAVVTLKKVDTDEWDLFGLLALA